MGSGSEWAAIIAETMRTPVIILDGQYRVRAASAAFCEAFSVPSGQIIGHALDDLGDGAWRPLTAALRAAGNAPLKDFTLEGNFPHVGARALVINAHTLANGILIAIEDRTDASPLHGDWHALLRASLESTADGLVIVDMQGNVLTYNQKFVEMWHLSEGWETLYDREARVALIARQVRNAQAFLLRTEELMRAPEAEGYGMLDLYDGRSLEYFFTPYRVGGQVVGKVWSFRDLTDRLRAEADLRESEARFRQMAENIEIGFWIFDLHTRRVIYTNAAHDRILGVTREQLNDDPYVWMAHIHPEDRAAMSEAIARQERGEPTDREYRRLIPSDGRLRWIRNVAFPVRDEKGDLRRVAGFCEDVTARKEAEMALRESELRFRQLADNIQSAFWIFDARARKLLYVSPVYKQLIGHPGSVLRDSPYAWLENVHPDDRAYALEAVQRQESGEQVEAEYRMLTPEGGIRWMRSRSFPVFDDQGALMLIAGIAEDISLRKEAERQALELALERERVEMLENFIADASHDLKTPITVLKSSVYLIERYAERMMRLITQTSSLQGRQSTLEMRQTAASIYEHSHTLEGNVTRLQRLVESLLDMFRLDRHVEFDFTPHDLNRLVESLLDLERALAAEKRLDLRFEPGPNLPTVYVDPMEMRRVIQNLVGNAIAYTPSGGHVVIRTATRNAESVILEVADTGVGIPEEALPHIFDRFFRADKSRPTDQGGMGLGLAIANRIVEAHGGRIEVDTHPGVGSTFRVVLPHSNSSPARQPSGEMGAPGNAS